MAIFMKGISRYILTMLVPFLCLSCTDEIPMPAGCGAAGGVDRGKTVRVSLPFSVSGGMRWWIGTPRMPGYCHPCGWHRGLPSGQDHAVHV